MPHLSVGTYHAVMQMPSPTERPDPCLLLLPEILASLPADETVALPEQGTAHLRFALDEARHAVVRFPLEIPHYRELPIADALVLVLPRLFVDAHNEYRVEQVSDTLSTWDAGQGFWTHAKLRELVVDMTAEARGQGYRRMLMPFITGGVYSQDDLVRDMQIPYSVAWKCFASFRADLLVKEF